MIMKAENLYTQKINMEKFTKARHFLKAVLIAGFGLFCTPAHAQTITTLAGSGGTGHDDGPASTATFQFPQAVATDGAGNVYVADQNNHIVRKITAFGTVTTIAGNFTLGSGYAGDNGPATDAQISDASGIAVDGAGNIYFSDFNNQVIRKIDAAGNISTFAGNNLLGAGYLGDNGPATDAQISGPTGVVVDAAGNVYFAESGNNVIRKVDPAGIISTYAGNGLLPGGYSGDNGPATAARFNDIEGLAIDGQGNIYVAQFPDFVVRRIDANTGIVTTIAGDGTNSTTPGEGDGGAATAASISSPYGVAADRSGNVYIVDANNSVIRRINSAGIISTFAGNGTLGYTGDNGPATAASIAAAGVATDNAGNVYIADFGNHVIRLIANQAPTFVTVNPTISMCQDAGAFDFSNLLGVTDDDAGQTETFTLTTAPTHGTVVMGTNVTSGGTSTPTGFTYTPAGTYHGTDAFTITADDGNGGVSSVTINVTVNPTPILTNTTTPTSICNGQTFVFTQSGSDAVTYNWGRAAVPHISTPAANGTGNISEALTNDTAIQVVVTYLDTLISNAGCTSVYSLVVTVNPTPTLYPTPLVGSLCDGATFGYTATSKTPALDITYSWSRAAYPGNPATSGTGATISETLVNNTTAPFTVDYIDTLKAYGCTNIQTVQVVVNPTPRLTSTLTPHSICDSSLFRYLDSTQTTGVNSITWTRGTVAGIANPAGSGADSIKEYLDNTTANPIAVSYVYTLVTSSGCTNTHTVTVFVNPTPHINTSLTPAAICDSTLFHYTTGTNTIGANIAWTRAAIAGISNPASSGTGDVNEFLHNTTAAVIPVTYAYTVTIDGCSHVDNVIVAVNPKPVLNNSSTSASPLPTLPICDNTTFNFTPSFATAGSTFTWDREFVSGIGALPKSGTGTISETLKNNTNVNVSVMYTYTVTANGCSSSSSFSLQVHPTPTLISDKTGMVCSGVAFNYDPKSLTPDVTFAWSVATLPSGVTATPTTGNGEISTTFTNMTSTDKVANIAVTTKVGTNPTCSYIDTVKVTIQSVPTPATIATMPSGNICAGAMYQNFGASNAPTGGTVYEWSATNATVWAAGNTGQYVLVNFTQPGTSVITLSATEASGCTSQATYTVTVGAGSLSHPEVIYVSSHFVCLDNSSPSFQWGYDDAYTLDSTVLTGNIDQSYFLQTPDFVGKHYWVITKSGDGCYKKTYYNAPTGVIDLNGGVGEVKVYPNPATSDINVEVNTTATGKIRFEVLNMLGQKVNASEGSNNKTVINVANLPAGYYIVDCYISDIKTGTAKFIKN